MNELVAMASFVAVARVGSFAGAARHLGLSTTAVSRHIAELERHLGVTLLRRTTRSVTLTETGSRYLPRAAAILDEIERLNAEVAATDQAPRGLLRITMPPGIGHALILPMTLDFVEAYPEVSLELDLSERIVDLVAEGFDAALRSGPLPDSALIAHRLVAMPYRLVASPAYLAAHGTPRSPEEVGEHTCLHWRSDPGRTLTTWTFARDGVSVAVRVRRRLLVSDLAALRDAALRGLGLTILPELALQEDISRGRLVPVLPGHEVYSDTLSLVRPPAPFVPTKLRAFIDFATVALHRAGRSA